MAATQTLQEKQTALGDKAMSDSHKQKHLSLQARTEVR